MLRKAVLTVSITLMCLSGFAQSSINDYKYILVPKQFEFSKSADEYQLSSLTNFLFNKYGYQSYLIDEDLPEDLKNDRCLALMVDVSNDKSGIFKTKIEIALKDCFDNEVMVSRVGESRLKKFDKAYNEALRDAFETFKNVNYNYSPKSEVNATTVEKQEPQSNDKKESEVKQPDEVVETINEAGGNAQLYYAQAVKDGYQLVDSEPKIIMLLINTGANDVFMVKNKNAIVYKENNQWVYYENTNGDITKYTMNIKF
ncbi:hypothetical protein [Winogradskyella sp.]|uniref:hypothetical protein n=1 Tax=Winogradskyella sp. TaxID=1883156 RepID=UPI001B1F42AC|nr:hypothetical protein [Winogradskyella sp.]MBO6879768.1 hypothetical protein [Winogradskyella sp.]